MQRISWAEFAAGRDGWMDRIEAGQSAIIVVEDGREVVTLPVIEHQRLIARSGQPESEP